MYSEQLKQHFYQPQYCGKFTGENPQIITLKAGDSSSGCLMEFALLMSAAGMIEDIKWQVQGCPASIACLSYVASELINQPQEQMSQITAQSIIEALDLAPHKQYSAYMIEKMLCEKTNI